MGEWIRGEITTRRLCVLADYLPQDSPLQKLRTEGKTWGLQEQLLWMILGEIARQSFYMRGRWKIKKNNDAKFSWPKSPWDEEAKPTTWGHVEPEDQMAAISYLKSLSPTK